MDWCFKHDRSFGDYTECPDCLAEMEAELIMLRTELTNLKALVREMGIQLENINKYNKYWYDTHESIFRMLSRPEVKKLMEG